MQQLPSYLNENNGDLKGPSRGRAACIIPNEYVSELALEVIRIGRGMSLLGES